ncbi:hypothetical protein C5S53_04945 [Methanophagales archaeon]|jgi:hypothetical protein|nr:hypothetical protein C5S53_04945 [Methanophagales archaeon]
MTNLDDLEDLLRKGEKEKAYELVRVDKGITAGTLINEGITFGTIRCCSRKLFIYEEVIS